MRELIRGFQDRVAGEIARLDGHLAKFMGDGALAYFGWPQAHENDAERARKSAISFAPDQKGLVIAEPRETEPTGPRALAPA